MRPALFVLLAAIAVLAPVRGRAQSPPPHGRLFGTHDDPRPDLQPPHERVVMRLDYTRPEGCPDEALVRATIGGQVRRWDPFAPNAPWRLIVSFVHGGRGYEGSAMLLDVTGTETWRRPLAPRARCQDLAEDLAIAVAFHIDPPKAPDRPLKPEPVQPLEVAQPPKPDQPSEVAPVPGRFALRIGAGSWMDLASAPRPAFGLTADVGFRVAWFSLAGELRWDPPAGAAVKEGVEVSTARVMGALVPCGHVGSFAGGGSFFGCFVGELGQIRGMLATARSVEPEQRATIYGTAGGRFGVEVPLVRDRLSVRVAVNLLGVPRRPRFLLGARGDAPETAWESPAFTGGLGTGLFAAF